MWNFSKRGSFLLGLVIFTCSTDWKWQRCFWQTSATVDMIMPPGCSIYNFYLPINATFASFASVRVPDCSSLHHFFVPVLHASEFLRKIYCFQAILQVYQICSSIHQYWYHNLGLPVSATLSIPLPSKKKWPIYIPKSKTLAQNQPNCDQSQSIFLKFEPI